MRCEQNHNIDNNFQTFLDSSMKGDSTFNLLDDIEFDVSNPTNSRQKLDKGNEKSLDPILKSFLEQGNMLLQHIAAATEEQKRSPTNKKKLISMLVWRVLKH
jgi:hypothetical protein